jgi:hypothetical protein
MENPSYWAIIPARVRYSDIKPNAKLLYGEITCLTNKMGYCFATNNYFAKLYNVSKNTISLWIKELKDKGFVSVEMIYKDKQIIERRIGITKFSEGGVIKKDEDNKIKINTIKDISYRKKEFQSLVSRLDYDTKNKVEFCEYWTEQNQKGTKMRFEMEKTFDINLRLKRWMRNNSNWKKPTQKSKIKTSINAHQKAREMIRKMNNNLNT